MPDKSFVYKDEKCSGGKLNKERLTVLLCANSNGSEKLPPLVIGKSVKPRCFKNVRRLPCEYRAQCKAWMTGELFSTWLQDLDASYEELEARGINIDEYLNVDDNLLTTGEKSLDQIIANHQTPAIEKRKDNSDDKEENSEPPLSKLAAFHSLSALRNYFSSLPNVPQEIFFQMNSMENVILHPSCKQRKIDDYVVRK
ncbi:hypothetical protein PGB90_006331 [Kerria lacca]